MTFAPSADRRLECRANSFYYRGGDKLRAQA